MIMHTVTFWFTAYAEDIVATLPVKFWEDSEALTRFEMPEAPPTLSQQYERVEKDEVVALFRSRFK